MKLLSYLHLLYLHLKRHPKTYQSKAIKIDSIKTVYVPVPKVACSSLTAVCVDLLGFDLPNSSWKPGVFRGNSYDDYIDTELRDDSHISVSELIKYSDYWKFALIRDPIERLISCYFEKVCNTTNHPGFKNGLSKAFLKYGNFYAHMPFDEFALEICKIPDKFSDPHFRSQYTFLFDEHNSIMVDEIFEISELQIILEKLNKLSGKSVTLPHLLKRKSTLNLTRDNLSENLLRKLNIRYSKDYELLCINKSY